MKLFLNPRGSRLLYGALLLLILFGVIHISWRIYNSHKYSTHNWNTYYSRTGKFSFKYPDTKMYLTEYGGLTLHTYYLPPNEIIPSNIYIQFTTKSMGLTKAETILKRCKINKRKTVNAYDATYEIYENAKCGDSFNTEVDIYANNNMDYLISVPNTIDSDFLNSFLSTFKFYTQIPENLSGISPTPKLKLPKRILPTAGLQSKWNIYENEKFGFTISYPANWKRGLCSNGAKNWDVCI